MKIYGATHKGLVRSTNQDCFDFELLTDTSSFAVVCDGMGGANAGNVASQLAVQVIKDYLKRALNAKMSSMQIENILRSALYSANSAVYDFAVKDENLKGMGTTVVLLFIYDNTAYILHVGDSRAYRYSGSSLTQLTVDHSMVQSMVDNGQITTEEAKVHPNKNIITRALGVSSEVNADLNIVNLEQDDILLLCTDGLSNYVSEEKIVTELTNFSDKSIDRLIELANEGGGGDNITAIAVKI